MRVVRRAACEGAEKIENKMKHRVYNEDFKKAAVQKALSSKTLSISGTARQLGIPSTTFFQWKNKYANSSVMKKTSNTISALDWTAEEKLDAIINTSKMSENEFGEYLRLNGLNSCDLEAFKKDYIANATPRGRPRLDPEVVQLRSDNKELKRDLNKKDRALAEMSARVILLKKSRLLWGDPEDEE